jgi:triosephosphate isomerase
MIHLPWVLSAIDSKIKVSAQNASRTKMGAFTGEVTA